jgi:thioredoxin-related protein
MDYIPIVEYVRRLVLTLLLIGAFAPAGSVSAAELLMFERAGCPWCARWNREVAPGYVRSEEGEYAPLRRIDLDRENQPRDIAFKTPVRFTPTFVLVDQGREIGRLIGYIDAATFWGLFAKMVRDHREGREPAPHNAPIGGRSG